MPRPRVKFSRHARERVRERLSLSVLDVASLIDQDKVVLIGQDANVGTDYVLFYSRPDARCFVALLDSKSSAVITVMPVTYEVGQYVTSEFLLQARELVLGQEKVTLFRCTLIARDILSGKKQSLFLGWLPLSGMNRMAKDVFMDPAGRAGLRERVEAKLSVTLIPLRLVVKKGKRGRAAHQPVPDHWFPKPDKGPQLFCYCLVQVNGDVNEEIISLGKVPVSEAGTGSTAILNNHPIMDELRDRLVLQLAPGQRPKSLKMTLGPRGPQTFVGVPADWEQLYRRK